MSDDVVHALRDCNSPDVTARCGATASMPWMTRDERPEGAKHLRLRVSVSTFASAFEHRVTCPACLS